MPWPCSCSYVIVDLGFGLPERESKDTRIFPSSATRVARPRRSPVLLFFGIRRASSKISDRCLCSWFELTWRKLEASVFAISHQKLDWRSSTAQRVICKGGHVTRSENLPSSACSSIDMPLTAYVSNQGPKVGEPHQIER